MAKLTANTHGYEFELMPNVIVQYDANEIGGMVHVDSFEIVAKAKKSDDFADAWMSFNMTHDDLSVEMACIDHFVNKVF